MQKGIWREYQHWIRIATDWFFFQEIERFESWHESVLESYDDDKFHNQDNAVAGSGYEKIGQRFGILYWTKLIAKEYGETEDYIFENITIKRFRQRIQMYTLEKICDKNYIFLKNQWYIQTQYN